jgi:dihydroorotase
VDLLIRNGRVVDPASGTDGGLDVLIVNGRISDVRAGIRAEAARTIDASGLVVAPGFIDMHVHLREPGFEEKETIRTGSRAAARGGFTTVCCMPNTNPVNDSLSVLESIRAEARKSAVVNVLPIAAVTRGLKGAELTDMAALFRAGAIAFSDDGRPVGDALIMRRALEASRSLGTFVIDHCEDKSLSADGTMHEGRYSRLCGLKGIPAAAEEVMVVRDIRLAEMTGARVHIAHLSVKGAVRAVEEAKKRGVQVTAEATPHHVLLTDALLERQDTNFKMNPPLRSAEDVEALVEAVKNGVIDAVATDHAPHTVQDKEAAFANAPFGVIGLETAVPLLLDRFVRGNIISLRRFIELLSTNPARLLGLTNKGRLTVGADADITLLDLSTETVVDSDKFESKSRNSPFHGWKLKGATVMTVVGGKIVFPFQPETGAAG